MLQASTNSIGFWIGVHNSNPFAGSIPRLWLRNDHGVEDGILLT
jgi:hypothetical protein